MVDGSTDSGDTRERILRAATDEFVAKGLAGARMQEIADRAGVNKAMLHYYYQTKDHLYEQVILTAMSGVMSRMREAIGAEGSNVEARLRNVVSTYFDELAANPYLPRLIVQDVLAGNNRMIGVFQQALERAGLATVQPILTLLDDAMKAGVVRRVDPKQTMLSLIGMVVFYFVAQPVQHHLLDLDDHDAERFLRERKRNVMEIFFRGVLACDSHRGNADGNEG